MHTTGFYNTIRDRDTDEIDCQHKLAYETMKLIESAYSAIKTAYIARERRANLSDEHSFVNRQTRSPCLVVILAGYKQPLWPYVFPRLVRSVPTGADVCLMSAGKHDRDLDELARVNGWSYLATRTNDVSLVQNIAIHLHPEARTIVKVDEDIFLTEHTLSDTINFHQAVSLQGIVEPCLTAPMLNINGVCCRPMLQQLGLLEQYEARFGVAKIATLGIKATDDAEAAKWLWAHTWPLEATVAKLRRTVLPELLAPIQFSIGVIVCDRSIWDQFNYFPVYRRRLAMKKSTLGADEEHICRMAMLYAKPIVVCQHALAGHFSFGRQYSGMLSFLESHPHYFAA